MRIPILILCRDPIKNTKTLRTHRNQDVYSAAFCPAICLPATSHTKKSSNESIGIPSTVHCTQTPDLLGNSCLFSVHRNLKALQTSYKKVYKNVRHTREAPAEFLVKAGDHPKIKLTLVTQNCRKLNEQLKFTKAPPKQQKYIRENF